MYGKLEINWASSSQATFFKLGECNLPPNILRWYDTLKYGDFPEKLNFLKIKDLIVENFFEVILQIFL